jgi:PIN domain nuclease of toxin-antitoxin system
VKTYVFDTHAVVWYLTAPDKLGRGARRACSDIEAGRAIGMVPVVSLIEITLLRERGRTRLNLSAIEDVLADVPAMRFLPLDRDQAKEIETLSSLPDVFDRMIVAAARSLGAALLSCDGTIGDSGLVRTVWD